MIPFLYRAAAILVAIFAFAISLFLYFVGQSIGFPDGYLTEFDRARLVLFKIVIATSIPAAFWFCYLGLAVRFPRSKLNWSIICYSGFLILIYLTHWWLGGHLDSGGGG